MAVNEMVSKTREEKSQSEVIPGALNSPLGHYGYRELPGLGEERLDVLEQLKANIGQLDDLHGRLRFMMGELQTLIKRR